MCSGTLNAFVPPSDMYQHSAERLLQIEGEIAQIKSSIEGAGLDSKSHKNGNALIGSLEEEHAIIEKRLEFLRSLEKQGLIMYSSGSSK